MSNYKTTPTHPSIEKSTFSIKFSVMNFAEQYRCMVTLRILQKSKQLLPGYLQFLRSTVVCQQLQDFINIITGQLGVKGFLLHT